MLARSTRSRAQSLSHVHRASRADGTQNLFEWDVKIPARKNSVFYPALLPATITFTADYPDKPPKVKFLPIAGEPLFHPNVYTDGGVCLSIINPEGSRHAYGSGGTWKPTMNLKTVLNALQLFLDEATSLAAGRDEAYRLWKVGTHRARCQAQVAKLPEECKYEAE